MKLQSIFNIALALVLMLCATACGDKAHKAHGGAHDKKQEKPFRYDDLQPQQLAAAQKFGIQPIENRDTDFSTITQLEKIEDCDLYEVEYLSHSVPYLTHNAKKLLDRIARDFQDSLRLRGVRLEKIVVTSVLRTTTDVKHLQRVNSNAVPQSTHCYGTTFDIAHNHFNAVNREGVELPYIEQKKILAHVLYRLRMQGLCYVLCEERQPCFHITSNR